MTRCPIGMSAAHQNRVLVKEVHKAFKGQKISLLFMRLQSAVQLQDCLQRADGQNVSPFCHIRFHAGKNPQSVFQLQAVPDPAADRSQVAIKPAKLQGIEMLRQAQGIQPGSPGFCKKPVCIGGGKWQLLGKLAMGMKIKSQRKTFFQNKVAHRMDNTTHKKETARKSRSLLVTFRWDSLIFFTALLVAAYR